MTLTGYICGKRIDGHLLQDLSARGVKETSVQLSWKGTTKEGDFDPARVYQVALYETLRKKGKPAYFPDVIVDNASRRRYYLDYTALDLLQQAATCLNESGIKAKVKISKRFFDDTPHGGARETFDKLKTEGLEASFSEEDANKVMELVT